MLHDLSFCCFVLFLLFVSMPVLTQYHKIFLILNSHGDILKQAFHKQQPWTPTWTMQRAHLSQRMPPQLESCHHDYGLQEPHSELLSACHSSQGSENSTRTPTNPASGSMTLAMSHLRAMHQTTIGSGPCSV